jgi:hypothetical protein
MANQGEFKFPGITGVLNASVTFSLGIQPSVTSVSIPPSPGLNRLGTAIWSYSGVVRQMPNSVVDNIQVTRPGGQTVWQVAILDRRWMWAFGQIAGEYNVFSATEADNVVPGTAKNPRELAELCLKAMDEQAYDVAALPENDRPYVLWDNEVPAKALADICDLYGCAVSLTIDNRVKVVRIGEGQPLPPGSLNNDNTLTFTNVPKKLAVLSSPIRWQVDLELEAVGLDTDGDIKLIDDLSYKPVGGWSATADFRQFGASTIANEKARDLANQTVYRWYRVKLPFFGSGSTVPFEPEELYQILPLIPFQATRIKGDEDEEFEEAVVWGKFYDLQGLGAMNTTANITKDDFSFGLINRLRYDLDELLGVIKYSEPVIAWSDTTRKPSPAKLYYRCCVNLRDKATRAPVKQSIEVDVDPTSPASRKALPREDLIPLHQRVKEGQAFKWQGNTDTIKTQAEFYLEQELANYKSLQGIDADYPGFVPFANDGAIRQVSYNIAESGEATSKVSYNMERVLREVTFKEARRAQQLTQVLEKQKQSSRTRKKGNQK